MVVEIEAAVGVPHQASGVKLVLRDALAAGPGPNCVLGHRRGDEVGYVLLGSLPARLANFRDHLNDLYS